MSSCSIIKKNGSDEFNSYFLFHNETNHLSEANRLNETNHLSETHRLTETNHHLAQTSSLTKSDPNFKEGSRVQLRQFLLGVVTKRTCSPSDRNCIYPEKHPLGRSSALGFVGVGRGGPVVLCVKESGEGFWSYPTASARLGRRASDQSWTVSVRAELKERIQEAGGVPPKRTALSSRQRC